MKRNEAERLVKSLGGSAKSSVTRDLSFLVTNEPASSSSKSRKARELGIPVIDEPAFLALARGETIAVEPPEPAETSPAKSPQKDPGNQMELGL
jgi:DNA ligase (NAD+)